MHWVAAFKYNIITRIYLMKYALCMIVFVPKLNNIMYDKYLSCETASTMHTGNIRAKNFSNRSTISYNRTISTSFSSGSCLYPTSKEKLSFPSEGKCLEFPVS